MVFNVTNATGLKNLQIVVININTTQIHLLFF
jgi:hypothetical protein